VQSVLRSKAVEPTIFGAFFDGLFITRTAARNHVVDLQITARTDFLRSASRAFVLPELPADPEI
jgi:hypothetical protein